MLKLGNVILFFNSRFIYTGITIIRPLLNELSTVATVSPFFLNCYVTERSPPLYPSSRESVRWHHGIQPTTRVFMTVSWQVYDSLPRHGEMTPMIALIRSIHGGRERPLFPAILPSTVNHSIFSIVILPKYLNNSIYANDVGCTTSPSR